MYGEKRGIALEEHRRIIARETNPERRDFYELLWFLGSSQTDLASLHGEDVNWEDRLIHYRRKKSGSDATPRFGVQAAAILARRPKTGSLFPYSFYAQTKKAIQSRKAKSQTRPQNGGQSQENFAPEIPRQHLVAHRRGKGHVHGTPRGLCQLRSVLLQSIFIQVSSAFLMWMWRVGLGIVNGNSARELCRKESGPALFG